MKSKLFLMVTIALLLGTGFAETQTNDGAITDVIVYHGRALVTRTIQLEKAGGDVELLVENLPERILPESIYAQAADGIQVLSVRYRVKEIEKDMRAEVRAIDEQIETTEKELYRIKRDNQLAHNTAQRFAKMWEFGFEGASVSLDRAAFSSETMKDFTSYLAEKGEYWHNRAVELEQKIKDLEKQLAELNQKKQELASQHKRSIRQALVYLHVPDASKTKAVQLSYLVDGANWSPQYNLKALPEKKLVDVEYNAVVHQSSGEDWTNAELALSTAVPALVATPPTLEPLEITLAGAGPREYAISAGRPRSDMSVKVPAQAEMQQQTQQSFSYIDQTDLFYKNESQRRANIAKGIKANSDLNFFATNNQMIEFEADKRLLQQIKEKAVAIQRAEGVSVMYRLPGRLTLPSKSDQQLVTIASIQCPAAFTFVAAPLLTDYVYLEGELTNTSDTILLPGSADTFRNGEFVGKGDMKLVTIGQTFTAGFGVDSQIQVTREFKDKKIETLWGNRMDEHQYRLEIDNYKNTAVALRLMDRLPWTESEALSIELTSNSHPLSTDAEYVRTQKDKGILRWDLNLKPETNGKTATVVNYTFLMKYDNDMAIRNVR
ncbi:MAG: mucoidy inhibitor MuiA family protein [Phycisphaerae bacterium]|nr:mucoidy inhibitor MuiA family protein [Phycisphaerae bacterium]